MHSALNDKVDSVPTRTFSPAAALGELMKKAASRGSLELFPQPCSRLPSALSVLAGMVQESPATAALRGAVGPLASFVTHLPGSAARNYDMQSSPATAALGECGSSSPATSALEALWKQSSNEMPRIGMSTKFDTKCLFPLLPSSLAAPQDIMLRETDAMMPSRTVAALTPSMIAPKAPAELGASPATAALEALQMASSKRIKQSSNETPRRASMTSFSRMATKFDTTDLFQAIEGPDAIDEFQFPSFSWDFDSQEVEPVDVLQETDCYTSSGKRRIRKSLSGSHLLGKRPRSLMRSKTIKAEIGMLVSQHQAAFPCIA